MAKICDVRESMNNFFPNAEYTALSDVIGKPVEFRDWEIFNNKDDVESVAILFNLVGDESTDRRTVTHSKAVIDLLRQDGISSLKGIEPLEGTIVEKASKKGGRKYLTIE